MASTSKLSSSSSIASSKKLEAELSLAKKQIQASRLASVKEMIERNGSSLKGHTSRMLDSAMALAASSSSLPGQENSLSARVRNPLCRLGRLESAGEKEMVHVQEEIASSGSTKTVVFGSSVGGKTAVRPVTLPYVEKIPTYTTWIFLDRNQRMAEDQSVVGRRQIYYDPYGNETLMYSDSEEDNLAAREEKHNFSEGEDQLLWKALQDNEKNQEVFNTLAQFIGASPSQIEERYEVLMEKHSEKHMKNTEVSREPESEGRQFLNKPLSAVLDSFDNLFCRRCLIFDCRLHGCSQSLILPSEKQSYGSELEENRSPCGNQCYLRKKDANGRCGSISDTSSMCAKGSVTISKKLETSRTSSMQKSKGILDVDTPTTEASLRNAGKRKALNVKNVPLRNMKPPAGCHSVDKKQNKLALSDASRVKEDASGLSLLSITDKSGDSEALETDQFESDEFYEYLEYPTITDISSASRESATEVIGNNSKAALVNNSCVSNKGKSDIFWSTLEKDLYSKGVDAFGKNCCLIARNLLPGLKTCMEVSDYMFNNGGAISSRALLKNSCMADTGNNDHEYMEKDVVPRTRMWRRKGRAKKKYTWKSAGYPSIRKRIGDGKQQIASQYTPCGCQQTCGKDCPCSNNSTCCEKYCGCSKSCRNRFRGCHCAKSQCRSRQCPCFAAGRECDPDVCRNCWISCGDGSLGEPPARGDGYQCGNMKLLLKQQQRILLGRSDIAGWGAFIKNPVNKNDYLGEYTGELISHKEADKRGKIYDLANSSFLFDLNDQYVLDAYRKGDKLKFANHSSNPNCYAKVMLVAGDHRVGIYAKENIEASEELFYDYHYGPDQAPAWAKKPEGSKRDDSSVSHKHAHKVA